MPDTQNQIYAQAYSQNIMQLAQQKESKLAGTVYMKPNVTGKVFYQDQIGAWQMEQKASRNIQTPNNDPGLARRMATMLDFHDARLVDRGDELRSISDPRSAYTIAASKSLGRTMDDRIIAAAIGTANSGETGSTLVTNGNIVLATAASITLSRIIAVKQALDDKDVDSEDRYFVATPTLLNNLLNTTQATSSDFASIKALVRGEIDTWMGFKWIMSTRLALASASLIGIAYQRTGLCMGLGSAPLVRADQRPDLSYSWQLYYELNIGTVRLEENKVVIVNNG